MQLNHQLEQEDCMVVPDDVCSCGPSEAELQEILAERKNMKRNPMEPLISQHHVRTIKKHKDSLCESLQDEWPQGNIALQVFDTAMDTFNVNRLFFYFETEYLILSISKVSQEGKKFLLKLLQDPFINTGAEAFSPPENLQQQKLVRFDFFPFDFS
jgi:hypothetical protein